MTLIKSTPLVAAVYLAGPMRGIPEFNFPRFFEAETLLREAGFLSIFNPARRDNEHHGTDISKKNATGSEAQAVKEHGFSLRDAMAADCAFICNHATHIALIPGWEASSGARAEHALASCLGHAFVYFGELRGSKTLTL